MAYSLRTSYGGYGIMVITPVCGTGDSSSILDSHPEIYKRSVFADLLCFLAYLLSMNDYTDTIAANLVVFKELTEGNNAPFPIT